MKRIALLTAFVFVLAGCGGGGNSGGATTPAKTATTPEVTAETTGGQAAPSAVALNPQNGSSASGTATFTGTSGGGVEVTLAVQGMPSPNASYLAHIHPGTCAEAMTEEETGEQGENTGDQEGTSAPDESEIEYPLQPVVSDSSGNGTSATDLPNLTINQLFSSSSPKSVNVHNTGPGEPPPIACGDLR